MNKWRAKDKGAILLTTLLVMSLMSALAVAMMNDIRLAILRTGNIQAHAQAEWYVKAAEHFAKTYVESNFLTLKPDQKNSILQKPIESTLPIEGGMMTLRIMDGTQCLPLNTFVSGNGSSSSGEVDDSDEGGANGRVLGFDKAFQRLLVNIGLLELDASNLTAAIIDWQDVDQQISFGGAEDYTYLGLNPPYRTSNTVLSSVSELRAVRGMTEEILTVISPFVCAGNKDRPARVNINTLGPQHLPLLSAIIGENEDALAAQVLQARPGAGFNEMATELLAAGVAAEKIPFNSFSMEPTHLWVEVDVVFDQANRTVLLEFMIDTDGLTRTYRHYGTEGRRPVPGIKTEETEGQL